MEEQSQDVFYLLGRVVTLEERDRQMVPELYSLLLEALNHKGLEVEYEVIDLLSEDLWVPDRAVVPGPHDVLDLFRGRRLVDVLDREDVQFREEVRW